MNKNGRPKRYNERKELLLKLSLPLVAFVHQYGHEHRLSVTEAIAQILEEKQANSPPHVARETHPHNSVISKLPDLQGSADSPTVAPPTRTQPSSLAVATQLDKLAQRFGLTAPSPVSPQDTQPSALKSPDPLKRG